MIQLDNWKKVAAIFGVIFLFAAIKVFMGPPPPGSTSWSQSWSDFINKKGGHLAQQIKQMPEESNLLEKKVRNAFAALTEEDKQEIEALKNKAVLLLPTDEMIKAAYLQDRLREKGYAGLSEEEVQTMQELNKKAFLLLPENDRKKLAELFQKAAASVSE